MDRFTAMQIFVRVVDLGSFTRAADSLGLTKAGVSQQVSRLEAHLGVRLLQRTTRQVRPTVEGAAYYDRIQRILDAVGDLESGVAGAGQALSGRLRIDVPAAYGVHLLAPALPDFRDRYPDIRLEIGSSDRVVDLLGEGVDCVIRGGTVFDESLVGRSLGTHRMLTYASPAYLARHGTPHDPEQLREHALVGYFSTRTGQTSAFEFERAGARVAIDGPFHVAFNDANAFLAAGAAGLGIVQAPDGPWVRTLVDAGRLQPILPLWSGPPLEHTLLYPSRRHLPARTQAFVDWAIEHLATVAPTAATSASAAR